MGQFRSVLSRHHCPFRSDNDIEVIRDSVRGFDLLAELLEGAQDSIYLLFYFFRYDEVGRRFLHILDKKRKQGVDIYVLYDGLNEYKNGWALTRALEEAGISHNVTCPFRLPDPGTWLYRDHRKLAVVDQRRAFISSANLDVRPLQELNDYVFLEGPVVADCVKLFADSWKKFTGKPLPAESPVQTGFQDKYDTALLTGLTRAERSRLKQLYLSVISESTSRIDLTTGYFGPNGELLAALEERARAGVSIRLLLSREYLLPIPVRRAGRRLSTLFFPRLLSAGAKIYLYQDKVMHAKSGVFDDAFSIVGSSNLDFFSLKNNAELNIGVLGKDFADKLNRIYEINLASAEEITLEKWRARPVSDKLKDLVFFPLRRGLPY